MYRIGTYFNYVISFYLCICHLLYAQLTYKVPAAGYRWYSINLLLHTVQHYTTWQTSTCMHTSTRTHVHTHTHTHTHTRTHTHTHTHTHAHTHTHTHTHPCKHTHNLSYVRFNYVLYIYYRIGALFFIVVNMGFINIPAVEIFLKERPIFV